MRETWGQAGRWAGFAVCLAGSVAAVAQDAMPDAPGMLSVAMQEQAAAASLRGTVKDINGTVVIGAKVTLVSEGVVGSRVEVSASDGRFAFTDVPAGEYTLTINAAGPAISVASGRLKPGESFDVPPFALPVPGSFAHVEVVASREDVATAQLEVEEKQRVLGVFPNFYTTYIWNAAPLTAKQKFSLAWRLTIDPIGFGMTGAVAGIEQAQNDYQGYHQGAAGYAKRYGASFSDDAISTFLAGAVLPTLLHQDPRYFYKGKGSVWSRAWYAVGTVVFCRGDNGKWQPNYSSMFGNLAAAGISNAYYPASDRHGFKLTIGNSLLGQAEGAAGNLFQEFFVKKLTPHVPDYSAVNKP